MNSFIEWPLKWNDHKKEGITLLSFILSFFSDSKLLLILFRGDKMKYKNIHWRLQKRLHLNNEYLQIERHKSFAYHFRFWSKEFAQISNFIANLYACQESLALRVGSFALTRLFHRKTFYHFSFVKWCPNQIRYNWVVLWSFSFGHFTITNRRENKTNERQWLSVVTLLFGQNFKNRKLFLYFAIVLPRTLCMALSKWRADR